VRRTCFVEANLKNYQCPVELVKKIKELESEGITIRKAKNSDKNAFIQYMKDDLWPQERQSGFANNFNQQCKNMIISVQKNKIAGALTGYEVNSKKISNYGGVGVLADYRNYGIGKLLLAKAMEECSKLGSTKMKLWTRPQTADRFYNKLGFSVAKNYDVYAKEIPQDFITEKWIARNRFL